MLSTMDELSTGYNFESDDDDEGENLDELVLAAAIELWLMTELHSDDGIAFRSPDDGKVDNVVKTHIHNLTSSALIS